MQAIFGLESFPLLITSIPGLWGIGLLGHTTSTVALLIVALAWPVALPLNTHEPPSNPTFRVEV